MIRDMQVHPIRDEIEHIDFQRILMTEKVRVDVPVELLGIPVGVKVNQGILDFVTRQVAVECLPGDIPENITLDVSELEIGQHLEAKALEFSKKVELLDDLDKVIVAVAAPRVAEEEAAEGEGLLEASTDEPEVIAKAKGEDES